MSGMRAITSTAQRFSADLGPDDGDLRSADRRLLERAGRREGHEHVCSIRTNARRGHHDWQEFSATGSQRLIVAEE